MDFTILCALIATAWLLTLIVSAIADQPQRKDDRNMIPNKPTDSRYDRSKSELVVGDTYLGSDGREYVCEYIAPASDIHGAPRFATFSVMGTYYGTNKDGRYGKHDVKYFHNFTSLNSRGIFKSDIASSNGLFDEDGNPINNEVIRISPDLKVDNTPAEFKLHIDQLRRLNDEIFDELGEIDSDDYCSDEIVDEANRRINNIFARHIDAAREGETLLASPTITLDIEAPAPLLALPAPEAPPAPPTPIMYRGLDFTNRTFVTEGYDYVYYYENNNVGWLNVFYTNEPAGDHSHLPRHTYQQMAA